jgi:hypothetical protein
MPRPSATAPEKTRSFIPNGQEFTGIIGNCVATIWHGSWRPNRWREAPVPIGASRAEDATIHDPRARCEPVQRVTMTRSLRVLRQGLHESLETAVQSLDMP